MKLNCWLCSAAAHTERQHIATSHYRHISSPVISFAFSFALPFFLSVFLSFVVCHSLFASILSSSLSVNCSISTIFCPPSLHLCLSSLPVCLFFSPILFSHGLFLLLLIFSSVSYILAFVALNFVIWLEVLVKRSDIKHTQRIHVA